MNLLIGAAMFGIYEPTVPIAVANMFSYQVWGAIFFSAGLMGVYGLLRNRWEMVRQAQLFGLLIKAIWLIALLIRAVSSPQTILIALVWALFAGIQAGVFIYFTPVTPLERKDG